MAPVVVFCPNPGVTDTRKVLAIRTSSPRTLVKGIWLLPLLVIHATIAISGATCRSRLPGSGPLARESPVAPLHFTGHLVGVENQRHRARAIPCRRRRRLATADSVQTLVDDPRPA